MLHGYEPVNIFNADETCMFFKCFPYKTLTFKNDECHYGKHSKERLTILLATNMSGTEKLPPLAIGKSKKPRYFSRYKSLPLQYEVNTKAWMTFAIFKDWLENIVKKMAKKKQKTCYSLIILQPRMIFHKWKLLNSISTHQYHIKIQVMDQGIIKNFKSLSKKLSGTCWILRKKNIILLQMHCKPWEWLIKFGEL